MAPMRAMAAARVAGGGGDGSGDDQELEDIRARIREMEEEQEKLKELQEEVEKTLGSDPLPANAGLRSEALEKIEADARSIYVGNVDYGATAQELEEHFHGCGPVNRVTILRDKLRGHPKGFAYIEFADPDSVTTALALDNSAFRGRQIRVVAKRTNVPGISTTNRGFPRARYLARAPTYHARFYRGHDSSRARGGGRGRGRGRGRGWDRGWDRGRGRGRGRVQVHRVWTRGMPRYAPY